MRYKDKVSFLWLGMGLEKNILRVDPKLKELDR